MDYYVQRSPKLDRATVIHFKHSSSLWTGLVRNLLELTVHGGVFLLRSCHLEVRVKKLREI